MRPTFQNYILKKKKKGRNMERSVNSKLLNDCNYIFIYIDKNDLSSRCWTTPKLRHFKTGVVVKVPSICLQVSDWWIQSYVIIKQTWLMHVYVCPLPWELTIVEQKVLECRECFANNRTRSSKVSRNPKSWSDTKRWCLLF